VGSLYTYQATVTASADPTGLEVGITDTGNLNCSANGGIASVILTMNVTEKTVPPNLSVSPATESLALTQVSSPFTGQVTISNTGGGTLTFTAAAASDQGTWLKLTGDCGGSATPSASSSCAFTADPTGLSAGLYSGHITFQDANFTKSAVVVVMLSVSQASQVLHLSQSALIFSATMDGSTPPPQSFTVSSLGSGSLIWTAQAQVIPNTLAPSANWLNVTSAAGSSIGGSSGSPVEISVNPIGLPPGPYYGTVSVDAPRAANSPGTVVVLLNVSAPNNTTSGVQVSSGGIILSGPAGSTTPAAQQIAFFNPSGNTMNYTTSVSTSNGIAWLSTYPSNGQLPPGSAYISLGANLSVLSPGVQTGSVTVVFDDGEKYVIQIIVIATGAY
jgi:hypothetical protein